MERNCRSVWVWILLLLACIGVSVTVWASGGSEATEGLQHRLLYTLDDGVKLAPLYTPNAVMEPVSKAEVVKTSQKFKYGYLGVDMIEPPSPYDDPCGEWFSVYVRGVHPGSPADAAGIPPYSYLVAVLRENGMVLSADRIRECYPGEYVILIYKHKLPRDPRYVTYGVTVCMGGTNQYKNNML